MNITCPSALPSPPRDPICKHTAALAQYKRPNAGMTTTVDGRTGQNWLSESYTFPSNTQFCQSVTCFFVRAHARVCVCRACHVSSSNSQRATRWDANDMVSWCPQPVPPSLSRHRRASTAQPPSGCPMTPLPKMPPNAHIILTSTPDHTHLTFSPPTGLSFVTLTSVGHLRRRPETLSRH